MFIPPIKLGQFQPSPATIAEWVYQIWQFLQDNPIATETEIREFIQSELTQSETLANAIEDYLTENPPPAPVQSVQGKTGAVQLAYNDIVTSSNAVPVYKAASTPSTSTLVGQYNLGYRLFVNTETQEIYTISPAGALSLVGRGKFDGTTIDVDSEQGDTTIAEALSKLNVVTTALLEWGNYFSGTTYELSDDMSKYDVILVQCGYSADGSTGGGAHCFYFIKPQTGSAAVYGCTYSAGGDMYVSTFRFTDNTHMEITANYNLTTRQTVTTGGTCIRLVMGVTIRA